MSEETKQKKISIFGYIFIFLGFLLFFAFYTFPYGILKESLSATINKETGYIVRIGSLGPNFPVGFEVKDVKVLSSLTSPPLEITGLSVELNLFQVFLGKLGVDAEVNVKEQGVLDIAYRVPILDLFKSDFIPSSLTARVDKFAIGNILEFGLGILASDPSNMMSGLLKKIGMVGQLNGKIDLSLNKANSSDSSGIVDLRVSKASLTLNEPSLGVSSQKFKKALVKANINGGKLLIAKDSGFHTQEFLLDMSGAVSLNSTFVKSGLDISVSIKLLQKLKKEYGFFLNMAGGRDGEMKVMLKGSMDRISTVIR